MQASKALLWFLVLGAGVAVLVFLIFPDLRPPVIENMFRTARGYNPAQSPTEAMEKFRDCIRDRDYKTAALYCGGEYREYLIRCGKEGKALVSEVDALSNAVDTVGLNVPKAKCMLRLLEPFPSDFKFDLKTNLSRDDYDVLRKFFPNDDQLDTSGKRDDLAFGAITFPFIDIKDPNTYQSPYPGIEPKILTSLTPQFNGYGFWVILKHEGNDKEKSWKIYFPLIGLREKADYLKQNYGNYVQGLKNVKYSVKHDAATKNSFENELQSELGKAK